MGKSKRILEYGLIVCKTSHINFYLQIKTLILEQNICKMAYLFWSPILLKFFPFLASTLVSNTFKNVNIEGKSIDLFSYDY